jgi:hypothetical protein
MLLRRLMLLPIPPPITSVSTKYKRRRYSPFSPDFSPCLTHHVVAHELQPRRKRQQTTTRYATIVDDGIRRGERVFIAGDRREMALPRSATEDKQF